MINVKWQDNTPISLEFDDIYFSKTDGFLEANHVFLNGNNLQSRWQNLEKDFTIIETGFGTGLNLFATLFLWQKSTKQYNLNYISIEKYPLSAHEIQKAISLWPFLSDNLDNFLENYSKNRFTLGNCNIILLFEDIATALPKISQPSDAWFLDGFAPSKNPDMWTKSLYYHMSRLTQKGGTLATFTSAGDVRRGLKENGFHIEKNKGFGKKRDMLCGYKI